MRLSRFMRCAIGLLVAVAPFAGVAAPRTFRVATYNLENYVDADGGGRTAKSAEARAKIREHLKAIAPDVLALQEMGRDSALQELRASLKAEGLDFPHWEHVWGFDTNISVAVLSKFPIVARRPHTNDNFLLTGRRFRVSRGFAEVDLQVDAQYTFTLLTGHLKSRRAIPEADEAEMRLEEAKVLREKIDAALARRPNANLILLGDLNDTYDQPPIKTILGRGRDSLVDLRPSEQNGDNKPNPIPRFNPRNITWTHFYGKEDSYSRIDYIFLSQGMARELVREGTFVFTAANWGVASDHRPVVATFRAEDR